MYLLNNNQKQIPKIKPKIINKIAFIHISFLPIIAFMVADMLQENTKTKGKNKIYLIIL
ncbi:MULTISPECIES: hypothetical protein [unclassified Campylobacter]|uniref:hypothetical protein n=1 Tax=unclassified Campylobacter TaxID=2593542 RepID=UPI0022EA090E|nr:MULTISPECIES: hypothetical protein [unclassified Campylobacter]MDA3044683.1 hypothetical protein [Campylobacter sp. JMF_07 ED4]MDA3074276.1 hypothetical protein [Campylobacter sp. JMF_05 ED3]